MLKQYKLIAWVIGLSAICFSLPLHSQPNWSVTPSDYQYNMSITGVGLFQCLENVEDEDMIAAFVAGECRGIQHFNTMHENRRYAFLTIYDSIAVGTEVNLKLYDHSEDTTYNLVYTIQFEENGILGSIENPYLFQTDYEIVELFIDEPRVYDYSIAGDLVGNVFSINEVQDTFSYPVTFVNDSLGPDNSSFSTQDNQLFLAVNTDVEHITSYQVNLEAQSSVGCTFSQELIIEVINTNVPPTGLLKTDTTINENVEVGGLVAELIAIDETPNDVHRFQLVGDLTDWPDHAFFSIEGTQLLSKVVFDYEERTDYTLQIEIKDKAGNIYIDTLNIAILDVIEFDDLKASNLVTPNEDGYNDFFEIPNVDLFANYELCIFNDNGNVVYRKDGNYNNDWDGRTTHGRILPSGTYYYVLRDRSKLTDRFKGQLFLHRPNKY